MIRRRRMKTIIPILLFTLISIAVTAQDQDKFEFKRIEDNSFFIEEAYNQDPGIIQHISGFQYMNDKSWIYTFTDEWPLAGKKHQISATVPLLDAGTGTGIGDIAINYRYQAVLTNRLGFSPRFTFLIPTGNYRIGAGTGVLSYQLSLPLSFILSRKFVTHYNLGATFSPGAHSPEGINANIVNLNYGTSVIWYTGVNFNVMVEVFGNCLMKTPGLGVTNVTNSLFISPGFRFAINFKSGLQIVPGLAIPAGIGPSAGNYGIFAYLSFEHVLWREKPAGR